WGAREANPFHHVVQDVLDRYVDGPPPAPDAPGAFRYASPGKLTTILQEAGADKVREMVFHLNLESPVSFDKFFEIRTEMSDSLRDKLRKLPEDQKSKFKSDVRENARPYLTANGVRFPMEVILISGASRYR